MAYREATYYIEDMYYPEYMNLMMRKMSFLPKCSLVSGVLSHFMHLICQNKSEMRRNPAISLWFLNSTPLNRPRSVGFIPVAL